MPSRYPVVPKPTVTIWFHPSADMPAALEGNPVPLLSFALRPALSSQRAPSSSLFLRQARRHVCVKAAEAPKPEPSGFVCLREWT